VLNHKKLFVIASYINSIVTHTRAHACTHTHMRAPPHTQTSTRARAQYRHALLTSDIRLHDNALT